MGLPAPFRLSRTSLGGQAGRDHGLGFDGLLVEPRSCYKSWIKAIGSDRNEMTMLRHLEVDQPFQGLKGGEHHVVAGHGLSTNQQSVRGSRIAIGKPILEPRPIH